MVADVTLLRPGRDEAAWHAWDRFVVGHPDAAFCHLSGHLQALGTLYGGRVGAVMLSTGTTTRGILGYVRPPGWDFAVSLPFYEYGGPLLAEDASPEEWQALLAAVGPAEFRIAPGWRGPDELVARQPVNPFAILPLDDGYEAILGAADRQVSKAVRKSEREGVRVVQNNGPEAVVGQFWPAYLRWMRDRHGTPPLPLRYWQTCQQRLGPGWRLFQAWHDSRLVAQLLGFAVGRRVVITTIVSDEDLAWPVRAVDALHAAFVRFACRSGYEVFDFGSARYEGQRRYKSKWGCRIGVYQRAVYPAGRALPRPSNTGAVVALAQAAWRRLPLGWTATLGPPIRERLTL